MFRSEMFGINVSSLFFSNKLSQPVVDVVVYVKHIILLPSIARYGRQFVAIVCFSKSIIYFIHTFDYWMMIMMMMIPSAVR